MLHFFAPVADRTQEDGPKRGRPVRSEGGVSSVSVIIPSYNYAHFLPGCVASVLSQQGVDVEVLVIDDCSSDDTYPVGQYLSRDSRVTFRRHDVNCGHIATYNEGIEWASGDYLAILSADDLLTPGALSRAAAALDANPGAGFVYGRPVYFLTNDALPPARVGRPEPQLWVGRDWIARRCKTATSCISSPEVVVRTSLQRQLGGYRPDLPHAGDVEMWLRFAAHSDVIYLRHVDQAYYRRHPQSMMRTQFASPIADLRQRRDAFESLFTEWGSCIVDSAALQDRASAALAREALQQACRALDREYPRTDAEDLVTFALETSPRAHSSLGYWGYRWRRRLGAPWSRWLRPLLLTSYLRRVQSLLWWRHWREFGV
jgi:hypothetical protein